MIENMSLELTENTYFESQETMEETTDLARRKPRALPPPYVPKSYPGRSGDSGSGGGDVPNPLKIWFPKQPKPRRMLKPTRPTRIPVKKPY